MFEIENNKKTELAPRPAVEQKSGAKIRVIGVGGGGGNAVNTMIKAGLTGVEYIVANTDHQALDSNLAPIKLQMGRDVTKGLGAGANPEVGRKAALEEYERLSEVLSGADMVFITAGMGGGTGTGAAPVIAKLAKELGALTVGVVTRPFLFEGKKRARQADAGISALEEVVDSLITIPNQRLLYLAGESLSLVDTFRKADEVLLNAVQGISDIINRTGIVNADFADVSTVMSNQGLSLMGTGVCTGPDRAIKAAREAINSPLLEDLSIDGATGIIVNITGNQSLTMYEVNEALTLINESADDDAEIIFGAVIDDAMADEVKITVIATGLGGRRKEKVVAQPKEVQKTSPAPERVISVTSATLDPVVEQPAYVEVKSKEMQSHAQEVAAVSPLAQSIQEAAKTYHRPTPKNEETAPFVPETGRARTIAEKLGFINFDEEDFDVPTFMRKEGDKGDLSDKRQN